MYGIPFYFEELKEHFRSEIVSVPRHEIPQTSINIFIRLRMIRTYRLALRDISMELGKLK